MIARLPLAAALLATSALPAFAAVDISTLPTSHMSCASGVCTPTAKKAVLNVGDLESMLVTSDVTVNSGAGAITIQVSAPFSWTSAHRLTLTADYNVSFKAAVAVQGAGGLTINANQGNTDGDLRFFPGGKVDFWDTSGSLVIGGRSHVLVNDLATLASVIAGNASQDVALTRDYDAGPDGTYANGAVTANFEAHFEGLGHTVSNFTAHGGAKSSVGLFSSVGRVLRTPVLRDLTMTNARVAAAQTSAAGILVGAISGDVVGVTVDGAATVGGNGDVGGLAGASLGTITRSSAAVEVTAGRQSLAGGLAGRGSSVLYSHATGNVTAGSKSTVGGLAGGLSSFFPNTAAIRQSWASGNAALADPTTRGWLGGFAGVLGQSADIDDCYALGSVAGGGVSNLGGFVGYTQAEHLQTSYSAGLIAYGGAAAMLNQPRIGGFLGMNKSNSTKLDYWNTDTSGRQNGCDKNCGGVKGLTNTQMKAALPTGFDLAVWGQNPAINNGYPYLLSNPPE